MNNSVATGCITQHAAVSLIQAALEASEVEGFRAAVAVTDAAGHLLAFQREVACGFLAGEVAIKKAWTAASFSTPTHIWSKLIEDPKIRPLAYLPQMMPIDGGFPLIENGITIGAIGVSGGNYDQDRRVAERALGALGFPSS
jgi:uncharacterized protein GlcG (DUF336 family)